MSHIREDKVSKVLDKIQRLLNKNNFNIPELLILYGNLGYNLGASMAQVESTGPSLEDLKKEYYRNPTVDTALMIQGLQTTTWAEDFIAKPRLSLISQDKEQKR